MVGVSDAADRWSTAVTTGTFEAGGAPKLVRFMPAVGRYVRLVATRETAGRAWTNVAELDLTGKPR